MGLLDAFNTYEGQQALGLLAAAGGRSDGAGFGQRLQEGLGVAEKWKQRQAQAEMQKQQAEMQAMQMAHANRQAAMEQAAMEQAARKREALPGLWTGGSQALAPLMGDPTTGIMPSAGRAAVPGQLDVQKALKAGYTADELFKLDSLRNIGQNEVTRTIKGLVNGREVEQQMDKFGRPVGQGLEQFKAPIMLDRGGQVDAVSPYTQPGQSFAKTMTFGDKNAAANLSLSRERLNFDKEGGVAAVRPAKQGPMSVTLQKELLESDDVAQSSKAIIGTLQQAKQINNEAYSGYGAKARATLASNMPWQSKGADATINLDNMMTGQGLDQMKTIFGAAPTEGERKILMDMQASADKTPQQREAIMDRAIEAANRRGAFANRKAQAIRNGTYLTDGIPDASPSSQSSNARTVVKTGMYGGKKVVQYSDGTTEYAN